MSGKKKPLLIYGALVLMLLSTCGWYVWQTLDAPPPRPAKVAKTPPPGASGNAPGKSSDKPASKALPAESADKASSPAQSGSGKPEPGGNTPSPPPAIAETGNVDGLSNLHVQIEEYKLLVQIEELRTKLAELKKAQTVAAAPPVQPPALSLPALTPPQSSEPQTAQPRPRRKGPVVLSVQGVDGNLVASVRLDGGRRITLRKGEKFGGGVVSEVSRSDGVVVRSGKKTTVLPFE